MFPHRPKRAPGRKRRTRESSPDSLQFGTFPFHQTLALRHRGVSCLGCRGMYGCSEPEFESLLSSVSLIKKAPRFYLVNSDQPDTFALAGNRCHDFQPSSARAIDSLLPVRVFVVLPALKVTGRQYQPEPIARSMSLFGRGESTVELKHSIEQAEYSGSSVE